MKTIIITEEQLIQLESQEIITEEPLIINDINEELIKKPKKGRRKNK